VLCGPASGSILIPHHQRRTLLYTQDIVGSPVLLDVAWVSTSIRLATPSFRVIVALNSMDSAYQEWALRTYGDSARTKTVTRKKYQRIVKILRGEENSSVENSKFRFWVKAKGFKLSCEPDESDILLVPCNKVQVCQQEIPFIFPPISTPLSMTVAMI